MALYTAESHKARDADGAVLTYECDSWHFTALEGALLGGVRASAFIDGKGKLHRRPLSYDRCYPGNSGSDSTKEMYVYGALYSLKQKDLTWVDDRYRYGFHHNWVMGDGEIWRTLLLPAQQAVLAQAVEALGGDKYPERLITPPRPEGLRGYEAFAQAVGVVFEGARFGAITDKSRLRIEEQAARNPRNMLYACLSARWGSGSIERAHALLLDPTIYPNDRLATSTDHCEAWITQRDDDDVKAWTPCPDEKHVHPAGGWLFAAAVCNGDI